MTTAQQLEITEQRLEESLRLVRQTRRDMIGNIRLTADDVARLCEYNRKSLYKFDIPFSPEGIIRYRTLEKWIKRNKPARLSRLKRNIKDLV